MYLVFPSQLVCLFLLNPDKTRTVHSRMGEVSEELLPVLHLCRCMAESRGAVQVTQRTPAGSQQRGGAGEVL